MQQLPISRVATHKHSSQEQGWEPARSKVPEHQRSATLRRGSGWQTREHNNSSANVATTAKQSKASHRSQHDRSAFRTAAEGPQSATMPNTATPNITKRQPMPPSQTSAKHTKKGQKQPITGQFCMFLLHGQVLQRPANCPRDPIKNMSKTAENGQKTAKNGRFRTFFCFPAR